MASQLKVNEIIKQSVSSITIGEAGDTASGIFTNTPAFSAKMSAAQSISNDTETKIAYDTEIVDTDSAYDHSTNYRFTVPSNEAGKYFIGASIRSGSVTDTKKITMTFRKNGSEVPQHFASTASSNGSEQYTVAVHDVLDLSVGDYIEVFVLHQSGSAVSFSSSSSIGSFFHGFKLIGA